MNVLEADSLFKRFVPSSHQFIHNKDEEKSQF
jgi:hypothetical protein